MFIHYLTNYKKIATMEFKWFNVNKVLPEDVMEHIDISKISTFCSKQTENVIIRFFNENKHEYQIIQGHRTYDLVYKRWKWSPIWYSSTDSLFEDAMKVTHWAYIPEIND